MKLRIGGNSIRLRILRSEVAKLIEGGRIAETIYLGSSDESAVTYALETESESNAVRLRYESSEIAIVLPKAEARSWAETERVGIYATVDVGAHGTVNLIVEKDFACLDLSDAENQDTFPNPQLGAAC
jgi:hypothetical protein